MHVHQKPATLFPWVTGARRSRFPTRRRCARSGAALALLHRAGQALPSSELAAGPLSARRARAPPGDLRRRSALFRDRARARRRARSRKRSRRAKARGPIGLIHQDLFPDNLLVDERGELAAMLDLEQATYGPLLYDLAVALNAWCWDGARIFRKRQRRCWPPIERAAPAELGSLAQWTGGSSTRRGWRRRASPSPGSPTSSCRPASTKGSSAARTGVTTRAAWSTGSPRRHEMDERARAGGVAPRRHRPVARHRPAGTTPPAPARARHPAPVEIDALGKAASGAAQGVALVTG